MLRVPVKGWRVAAVATAALTPVAAVPSAAQRQPAHGAGEPQTVTVRVIATGSGGIAGTAVLASTRGGVDRHDFSLGDVENGRQQA